jgi:bacterioferritin (cytochrome b1)
VVSPEPGATWSSRRTFLSRSGAGIAAGAALVLGGCGSTEEVAGVHKIPPEARSADVKILNGLLDLEYKAIAAYTAGIPLLTKHVQTSAKQFLSQEITHSDAVYALIKQAHGPGKRAKANYDLGRPRDAKDVIELLHSLEQAQIAGYLEAIPNVSPGSVRAALSTILANEAQHVVVLRRALHVEPLAGPFVTAGA